MNPCPTIMFFRTLRAYALQNIFEKYFSKILAYAEGIITKNALAFF